MRSTAASDCHWISIENAQSPSEMPMLLAARTAWRVGGDELRLSRNLGKRIMRNGVADHRDSLTIVFRRDQLRGMHAENGESMRSYALGEPPRCTWPGTTARASTPTISSSCLATRLAMPVEAGFLAESGALFFLHRRFLDAHRALSHGDDGEILAVFGAAAHRVGHHVDVIRNFRQEDDIRAARDARNTASASPPYCP